MIYQALNRRMYWDKIIIPLTERHPTLNIAQFPSILDLQIFAAIVGFKNKKRVEIIGDKHVIPARVVESLQPDLCPQLINLIALADSNNDTKILKQDMEKERVKIFEEYAEGGFEIIEKWFDDSNEAFAEYMIIKQLEAIGALIPEKHDDDDPESKKPKEKKKII